MSDVTAVPARTEAEVTTAFTRLQQEGDRGRAILADIVLAGHWEPLFAPYTERSRGGAVWFSAAMLHDDLTRHRPAGKVAKTPDQQAMLWLADDLLYGGLSDVLGRLRDEDAAAFADALRRHV